MTSRAELLRRADAVYQPLKDLPFEDAIERIDDAEFIQECVREKVNAQHKRKSEAPEYIQVRLTGDLRPTNVETGGGERNGCD